MQLHQSTILNKEQLSLNEWRFTFDAPALCEVAKPGQFVMVECGGNTFLRRAISINDCVGGKLSLMFAVVGEGTHALATLNIGDEVSLLGPLGNGFDCNIEKQKVAFIAGGIGKAPFEYLSKALLAKGNEITYVVGGRDTASLAGLDCYAQMPGVELFLATEDGSLGEKGFVSTYFESLKNVSRIYSCGPTPMLKAVQQFAEENNIPCQLSLEGKMACGVGVCLGCTCQSKHEEKPYPKVCVDGPVFWTEEVKF